MLQIKPLSISVVPPVIFSWPDTQGINVSFSQINQQLHYLIENAAILVADDLEADAVVKEMSYKDGMVEVGIEGHPGESLFVYRIFRHPEGKIFMCVGSDEKNQVRELLRFTQQIWPAEDII